MKKTTKKTKPARRAKRTKPAPTRRSTPMPAPAMPVTAAVPAIKIETPARAPTPTPTPSPRPRMTRARLLSPAAKRGAELVRYLRIHTKRPYDPRGERAIVALAKEVGHLARLQLDEAVQ